MLQVQSCELLKNYDMAKHIKIGKLYDWVPYFGLICILILGYIYIVHGAEKKIRKINNCHKEVEEIRREFYSIKQKCMYDGTLYQVTKHISGMKMDGVVPIPKKIDKSDA